MNVEIVSLKEENLVEAPEFEEYPFSCKYCIYWELPEEFEAPFKESKEELMVKKLNWLIRVRNVFDDCGKIIYVDRKPVGYAQYAPPKMLPRSAEYSSGPSSEDAVLVSCLFIAQKEYRGLGLGNQLLQSIIEDLKEG